MTEARQHKISVRDAQVGSAGLVSVINSGIALVYYFFPDWPWHVILPFVGALFAYFGGGQVMAVRDKRRYNIQASLSESQLRRVVEPQEPNQEGDTSHGSTED